MLVCRRSSENPFFEARTGGGGGDGQSLNGGRVGGEEEGVGEGCGEWYGVCVDSGWWTDRFGDRDNEAVEGLFVRARDNLEVYGSGEVVS